MFLAIRVSIKTNRFNIKHQFIASEDGFKSKYYEIKDDYKIDKRDVEIFNKFKEYIKLNKFEIKCDSIAHKYHHLKETYYYHNNIRIKSINLKEFKQYSNNI